MIIISYLAIVSGVIFSIGCMVFIDIFNDANSTTIVFLIAWNLVPYFGAVGLVFAMVKKAVSLSVGMFACLTMSGLGIGMLCRAILISPDPQEGLVFFFLPAWQIGVLMPFACVAQWLAPRVSPKKSFQTMK